MSIEKLTYIIQFTMQSFVEIDKYFGRINSFNTLSVHESLAEGNRSYK